MPRVQRWYRVSYLKLDMLSSPSACGLEGFLSVKFAQDRYLTDTPVPHSLISGGRSMDHGRRDGRQQSGQPHRV